MTFDRERIAAKAARVDQLGCVRCYIDGITRPATGVTPTGAGSGQSLCDEHAPPAPKVRHLRLVKGSA